MTDERAAIVDALHKAEVTLRTLLKGEHSSLTIGFNDDHACNYATAKEWHDQWGEYGGGADHDRITWVSEDERQKAIATNSVWTCQWYPDTPNGFCCLGASSLAALYEALAIEAGAHLEGEGRPLPAPPIAGEG